MMRGRMASRRIDGNAAHAVDESGFEHPYKLTYAASAGAVDGETGEADGAWIIWLPDGCLVIDGETVDLTANLAAANNYPEGWYDLTDIFDGTDPDEFDLYLDASKDDPKFVTAQEDAENPVLIAKVNGKAVKGVVESALVFSKGGNKKPFDIVTVEENNSSVKKVVRCHFRYFGNLVTLQDFTLPAEPSAADSLMLVWRVANDVTLTESNINSYWQLYMASAMPGESADYVMCGIKIYDFDASGNVTIDYRDADVSSDLGLKDNNTISDNDPTGAGQFNMSLHLKQFYGTERDLSTAPGTFDVLVRYAPPGGVPGLYYIPRSVLAGIFGGGGDDSGHGGTNEDVAVGGSGGIFAWTAATRTIGPGGCMVGRKWYTASGTGSGMPDGLYQLKITLSSSGATCQVVSGVSLGTSPSGDISYIPIYEINNAKIAADYRGAFVVPAYE